MAAAEPDDEGVVAAISSASPEARAELARALRAVEELGPQPSVPWSAADPGQVPYPQYPPQVTRLVAALDAAGARPVFDWLHWRRDRSTWTAADIAGAPLADVARVITTIVRGERFSEGLLARAVQDGSLATAARRIVDAQSE